MAYKERGQRVVHLVTAWRQFLLIEDIRTPISKKRRGDPCLLMGEPPRPSPLLGADGVVPGVVCRLEYGTDNWSQKG